eukprot:g3495.t1 g3495   contig12:2185998-2186506(+)
MSFPGKALQRTWHLVDATSQTVGRLATTIAPILKGKHKPTYRPNGDCGDYVVIVNADKVHLSGKNGTTKSTDGTPATPEDSKNVPPKTCSSVNRNSSCVRRYWECSIGITYGRVIWNRG